jgi:hypothetical protein
MPVTEDQKAQDDAHELRSAAVRLRDLIPQFREAPGTEFVPWSVANLLEAIAECVANGQRLRYKGVRFVDQKLTRTASSTTTLAQITAGRDRSSTTPTSEESGPPTCPGWNATSPSTNRPATSTQ